MASITSLGIGSGLDLETTVTKLLAADRAPINALSSKIASAQTRISLFGNIKTKLSALQTAADTLQFPTRLAATKVTSGDAATVSAVSVFGASSGTYGVEVTQLASAQKSFSQEYQSGTTFSPGALNFTVGGKAVSVDLTDAASYTLDDIRAKINNAGIGITATLINTTNGNQRLVLAGQETGAGNAFTLDSGLDASNGQAPLDGAGFDTATAGLARSDALDAHIKIDGVEVSSGTNIFTNIPGLTITANKLSTPGTPTPLKVETDADKIVSAVQSLVSAYNDVQTIIKSNSAYDPTSKTAQPLNGDFAARSVTDTLTATRTTIPPELSSNAIKTLSGLGITIQQNGQLSLDETKLRQTIAQSPNDVQAAIQAYGKAFSDKAAGLLNSSSGLLSNRVSSLNQAIQIDQKKQADLQARLVLIEKGYRAQFAAADTLAARFKSISNSLTQTFSKSAG